MNKNAANSNGNTKNGHTNGHSNGNETFPEIKIRKILIEELSEKDDQTSSNIELILHSSKASEKKKVETALYQLLRTAASAGLERGIISSRRHESPPEENHRLGGRENRYRSNNETTS